MPGFDNPTAIRYNPDVISYITQLLGKPVVEPGGNRVARIVDAIATQGGRLPTVTALLVKSKDREGWIPVDSAEINDDGVVLSATLDSIPAYAPKESDLRLRRDILDKQIVDV